MENKVYNSQNADGTTEEKIIEIPPSSWGALKIFAGQISQNPGKWIFRGHADESWELTTKLERISELLKCVSVARDYEEFEILREFERRAHHYISDPPGREEYIEQLALIQHHGGPTRLLDFTYSFYIALFFAIEKPEKDKNAAVWAINLELFKNAIYEKLKNIEYPKLLKKKQLIQDENLDFDQLSPSQVKELFLGVCNDVIEDKISGFEFVVPVEPFRMNERLAIQQSLFLFQAHSLSPFWKNLAPMLGLSSNSIKETEKHSRQISQGDHFLPAEISDSKIIKILIPKEFYCDAIKDLKSMNISAASLFPGLDGFARSLQHHLYYPIY